MVSLTHVIIVIRLGTANFEIDGIIGRFEGEVNRKGIASGEGTFIDSYSQKYKGLFRENKVDGFC